MYFLAGYPKLHLCSGATMENKRKCLSSVFGYLYKHKKIGDNPMNVIDPVRHKKCVKVPLSDEEIELIRSNCQNVMEVAMLDFMLDTGVRVSELCGVHLSDVDFKTYRCIINGKGNKQRIVLFDGKTAVSLSHYLAERVDVKIVGTTYIGEDTPLFTLQLTNKKSISKYKVEKILHDIGERSGIKRLHPHLIRATCATMLSKKGVDTATIAKYLGHADLTTINRYIIMDQEATEQALRSAGLPG